MADHATGSGPGHLMTTQVVGQGPGVRDICNPEVRMEAASLYMSTLSRNNTDGCMTVNRQMTMFLTNFAASVKHHAELSLPAQTSKV